MTKNKPSAVVRRFGRWVYTVALEENGDAVTAEPWRVLGYGRAVRKAKRELKKYIKRKTRQTTERIEL